METKCIRCGSPTAFSLQAVEVRTLHVRAFSGERRIQALGQDIHSGVCESCARDRLDQLVDVRRSALPRMLPFGIIFIVGLLLVPAALLFLGGEKVFVLLGIAAMICGGLGVYDGLRNAVAVRDRLLRLPEKEAVRDAAWDVFLSCAPKKEGENDLTYIPVNEKNRACKNGDLMVEYKLLPEIAVEAWKRINGNP